MRVPCWGKESELRQPNGTCRAFVNCQANRCHRARVKVNEEKKRATATVGRIKRQQLRRNKSLICIHVSHAHGFKKELVSVNDKQLHQALC